MKVKIVDTLSWGAFHAQFNSSVLLMCMHIFKNIEYVSSKSSRNCIEEVFSKYGHAGSLSDVRFKTIKVIEKESLLGNLCRYLLSCFTNIGNLFTTSRNTKLVYTNNNPLSLWGVNLLNYLLKRDILIFCHGELELLVQHPVWYKPSVAYKFLIKTLFKYGHINSRLKFCVLGDSILSNLLPYLNQSNKKNFITIEHPYFFKVPNKNKPTFDQPLKFGTVGVLNSYKGLFELLKIAEDLKDKITISVVGKVTETINYDKYPFIKFITRDNVSFLPRQQYEAEIEQLDYILFLYNIDAYKFTASGAIFDAIDFGKPIISLNNDYFKHILKFPIGYMFDTVQEIENILLKLSENKNEDEYLVFKKNILKLREYYKVENMAKILKNKI